MKVVKISGLEPKLNPTPLVQYFKIYIEIEKKISDFFDASVSFVHHIKTKKNLSQVFCFSEISKPCLKIKKIVYFKYFEVEKQKKNAFIYYVIKNDEILYFYFITLKKF